MNETIQKFGYPGTLIKEYEYWVVLLRPKQVTLGSLVVAIKGESRNLGEVSKEAWAEFAQVSGEAEQLLAEKFGAEKFNYLALMMKDPHVHFHLIPRYSKPVEFMDHSYTDADWPLKTEMTAMDLRDDTLKAIHGYLVG